jgi:hypothetical protein
LDNLITTSTNNEELRKDYTINDIKQMLRLDSIENSLSKMSLYEITDYYTIHEDEYLTAPDTLRPIYPIMVYAGWDYITGACGYGSGKEICLPAWNCLDSNGMLIEPGLYYGVITVKTSYDTNSYGSQSFWVVDEINIENNYKLEKIYKDLKTFPNPFNPIVTITFPNPNNHLNLYFYNVKGNLVHNINGIKGNKVTWETKKLANGVYILKAETGDKVYKRKLILQK